MKIQGSVALVSGANRGIGKAYVEALVQAGAARIYAAARNVETLQDVVVIAPDRIIAVALDVTQPDQISAVVEQTQDVTLLINNAGVLGAGGLFTSNSVEIAQWEMNTNYFGTLYMTRAFAPVLQHNGGGTLVNLLTIASVVNVPVFSSYSASKAALYSLTQGVRAELAQQGTLVMGVFPSPVDTAMSDGVLLDKVAPLEVAQLTLQAIEEGIEDVYPDPVSRDVFTNLHDNLKVLEKQFAGMLPK